MKQIVIKEGAKESDALALAHLEFSTVFVPGDTQTHLVHIYGSQGGFNYGPVLGPNDNTLKFIMDGTFYVKIFEPTDSAGLMYIKFVLDEPAEKDLVFDIYLLEGR